VLHVPAVMNRCHALVITSCVSVRRTAGDSIQTKSAIGVLLAQRLRAEFKEPIGIIQVSFTKHAVEVLHSRRRIGHAVGGGQCYQHRLAGPVVERLPCLATAKPMPTHPAAWPS
jgi:hypothetical protein